MPDQDQARPGQDRANWCITLQLVCVENDVHEISMRWAMGDGRQDGGEAGGMGDGMDATVGTVDGMVDITRGGSSVFGG